MDADAPRVAVWYAVPVAFPGRWTPHDCFVCFQLDNDTPPERVHAITRVPVAVAYNQKGEGSGQPNLKLPNV